MRQQNCSSQQNIKCNILALTTSIFLTSLLTHAEWAAAEKSLSNVMPATIVAPNVIQGPNANISQTSVTPLIEKYMSEYFNRQKEDKEYFEGLVRNLNGQIQSFQDQIVNKLQTLSMAGSQVGDATTVSELMELYQRYRSARTAYEATLRGVEAISEGKLPSAQVLVTENRTAEVPGWRNLDMKKLTDEYRAMWANLELQLVNPSRQELAFLVKDKEGLKVNVKITRPILEGEGNLSAALFIPPMQLSLLGVAKLTEAERRDYIKRIQEKKNGKAVELLKAQQNISTDEALKLTMEFYNLYGTTEKWRKFSEADRKARQEAYERLSKTFLLRSWTRAKYGVAMGTFNAKFTKKWAHLDQFLAKPSDFMQISKGSYVRASADLEKASDNFRNMYESLNELNGTELEGTTFFLSNFLAYGKKLLNDVQGNNNAAAAAVMGMRYMAADVKEEIILTMGGGHEAMREYFKTRYMSDEETKKWTLATVCEFDASYGKCPQQKSGVGAASALQTNKTSLNAIFQNMANVYGNALVDLKIAQDLEAEYKAMTENFQEINKAIDKAADDLFD